MADSKRPVGRPRSTLDDLPDGWEIKVADAGQDGASQHEIRCILGIGESAWETLQEDFPEFRRAIKQAKLLSRVWWEKRGRMMASGADGNSTVWIFNMKNRFGWRDQPKEDDQTPPQPVSITVNVKDARRG